jgi:Fic-DOC domain mobile mystery protein B
MPEEPSVEPKKIRRVDGVSQTYHVTSARQPEVHLTPDTFDPNYDSTPIEPDDHQYLMPEFQHLVTKKDLDRAEGENILKARTWLSVQHLSVSDLLDTLTLRDIHRRMFGDVWSWAGATRPRETSIGIDPGEIQTQWEQLVQNYRWRAENTEMSEQDRREFGLRFHTEMVAIHVFLNGNGRHARLVANLLAGVVGHGDLQHPLYTWGERTGLSTEESRQRYISSIKLAGGYGDFGPLLELALS